MDNLFSEDPQFRRVQYKRLSDNVREWQQEISAMIAEKLPKDLHVDVSVVFQQVDDEKGYAVGTAIGRDQSSNKTIGIPIIVKSWHLAPIDLFFCEGKLYPLTDDNLAKIFYQSSLGAGVAPQTPPPNMVDDVYSEMRNPPLGGKYSYSAPFSMLNLISGTLGSEDLKLLKTAVANDHRLLVGYQRHGTFDVLRKYAAETPKPTEQDEINKERTSSTFTIKKDGPDAYRLYSANDEVFDPVIVATNRQGLVNFLNMSRSELQDFEKDPMLVIDRNGHYTLTPPESPYGKPVDGPTGENALGEHKNPFVFDPLQDDRTAKSIDSFGRYGVRDRDGVLAKGWVIPNVVDFDGNTVSNKLFLGKALAAYQGRIAGIPLPDDAATGLDPDRPDTGKLGVLLYREGKDVFATIPFQITAVTVFKKLKALSIVDARGKQCTLIQTPAINGIVKVSPNMVGKSDIAPLIGPKDNYFVSANLIFIRMARLCPVSESPDDFKRIAAEWLDHNPIKVAMSNGRYVFRGGKIKKYAAAASGPVFSNENVTIKKLAFDFNSLPRHEAEFLLASWGLPMTKVAQVLDGVKTRIALDIHHLRLPDPRGHLKVAKPVAHANASSLKAPIAELVKIAANLEDAQTVDSVLSLGFVNPENVTRFASAKPMLWEVSHMLAKLLLASRLGMEDIPEEAARAAISHLQRVIDGLDRLKMLEEQQQTKVSAAKAPTNRHGGGHHLWGNRPVGISR